jgi:multiple sugar transport system permease protein
MFQKFDIVWLLTQGGPLEATQTLPVYIYKITFFEYRLDIGSAAAINLFVILVVIAAIYFWALEPSKEVETGR